MFSNRRWFVKICIVVSITFMFQMPQPEVSSTENKSVYMELFDATNAQSQYQVMMNRLFYKFNQSLKEGLYIAAGNSTELTQENRTQVELLLERILQRNTNAYQKAVMELLPYEELVGSIYIPLYSKYFSEEEVQAITAFFRSPAGQKFALKAPAIMQETASEIEVRYEDKLHEIIRKMQEEGVAELEKQLQNLNQ